MAQVASLLITWFTGAGVGNFVGGIIYETYGARTLFRCTGSVCALAILVFFFFTHFILRKRRRKKMDEIKEEPEDTKESKGKDMKGTVIIK